MALPLLTRVENDVRHGRAVVVEQERSFRHVKSEKTVRPPSREVLEAAGSPHTEFMAEVLARDISPGLVILLRVFIALRLKAVTKPASTVKIRGSVLPWQASLTSGPHASTVGGTGSIPGQGTKIPCALWCG